MNSTQNLTLAERFTLSGLVLASIVVFTFAAIGVVSVFS